jgi:PKD repeat protein
MAEKEESNVEVVESIPPKNLDSGDGKKKIIVIGVVAIVVIALLAYFFLLGGDDNGNGPNGNGNRKPFADFTYEPSTIFVNDTVNFDASNSTDLDGDELTYEWEFGDIYSDSGNPNTDSGKIGTHIFTVPGDYEVTLVVDDGDKQDAKTQNITVLPEEFPTVSVNIIHVNNIQSNLMWTITITEVEGTSEQLAFSNIRYNFYNGSDTNDVKFTGITSVNPVDKIPPIQLNNEIYFDDNGDSILSVGDFFSIGGDGGASIQPGDYFQLIYNPNNVEMMGPQPL